MEWKEYLELSEKTLSNEFHIEDKKYEYLLHATIGILTEVEELLDNHLGEVDSVNVLEEVGDITWYLAIIGREYNINLPESLPLSNEDPMKIVLSIVKQTCKLLDFLKKKIYYNKPINEDEFKQTTLVIMILLQSYMNHFKIDIKNSFDININKLKSRYGDKFSSDKAINRDLDLEREILESGKSETPQKKKINPKRIPNTSQMYLDGVNNRIRNYPSDTSKMYID